MQLLSIDLRNSVLDHMCDLIDHSRQEIISENRKDLDAYNPDDRAMYDRLIVDHHKIDGMIKAVTDIRNDRDPIGRIKYDWTHDNGMQVLNKTAPFGTIMIIYESRPDVTIEAAVVAFKSNNKILLKGGKEAKHSNRILGDLWHKALSREGLDRSWITLLDLQRSETQEYLKNPPIFIDLIVPRGGEGLISFVKKHASCPVLISGRGNNFIYIHRDADIGMAADIILQSKIQKISACNALDKVLIDRNLPNLKEFVTIIMGVLNNHDVEVLVTDELTKIGDTNSKTIQNEDIWYEEFLAMKIAFGLTDDESQAIELINRYSGGHSVSIITQSDETAQHFMDTIDAAAVYHNASTRFTDGGQMGIGAELAISTDKLHHRGPLGLHQLVTNKWYVFGSGQIRE